MLVYKKTFGAHQYSEGHQHGVNLMKPRKSEEWLVPTKICHHCGAEHSRWVLFCDDCGTSLEGADAQPKNLRRARRGYGLPQRESPPIPPENSLVPDDRRKKPRLNRRTVGIIVVLILIAGAQYALSYHMIDTSKGKTLYSNLTLNSSTASAMSTDDPAAQYTTELQQRGLTVIHPFSKGVNNSGHDIYTATATDGKFVYDVMYEFTRNQSETQTRYDEIVTSLQKDGYVTGLNTGETWTGYNMGFAATVKNAGPDVEVILARVDVNYFIPLPGHPF